MGVHTYDLSEIPTEYLLEDIEEDFALMASQLGLVAIPKSQSSKQSTLSCLVTWRHLIFRVKIGAHGLMDMKILGVVWIRS